MNNKRENPLLHILFFSRLILYMLLLSVPFFHPVIIIAYDSISIAAWFILIPLEMVVAKYFAPPVLSRKLWFGAAVLPLLLYLVFFQISGYALLTAGIALAAFFLTFIIFNTVTIGRHVAVAEQIFLIFFYIKFINFTRANEEAAASLGFIVQALFMLVVVSFIIHGAVIFFTSIRKQGAGPKAKEAGLLFGVVVPVLAVLLFILPPDFIQTVISENPLTGEVNPKPIPLQEEGRGVSEGNLQGGRRDGRGSEDGSEGQNGSQQGRGSERGGGLEGVPADKWKEYSSGRGGQGAQNAVLVVASSKSPVYMAGSYYNKFSAEKGFQYAQEQPLNSLAYMRLAETWKDTEYKPTLGRRKQSVFTLSTKSQRYVAYHPYIVHPTILKNQHYPFRFSYETVSYVSAVSKHKLTEVSGLPESEKQAMAKYLKVPLSEGMKDFFNGYLGKIIPEDAGYFEKAIKILRHFQNFQYEVGYDENLSLSEIKNFLSKTHSGDCTEFSHSSAILGRLAGIPTRVVTGYLASRDLQTRSHMQGVMNLRQKIDILKEYPLNELFLVTTSHRHAWVQFYFPEYGWIDFETTEYAKPPSGDADPNQMPVRIPIIEDRSTEEGAGIPYRVIFFVFLAAFLIALAIMYAYRYGRELYLRVRMQRNSPGGVEAMYRLLLFRAAGYGYEVKHSHETMSEYAEKYPVFAEFAEQFLRLRYRTWEGNRIEAKESCKKLRKEFFHVMRNFRKHVPFYRRAFRIIRLKGVRY